VTESIVAADAAGAKPEKRPLAAPLVGASAVLAMLAGMHFLVDIVAGTANPLWPGLEDKMLVDRGGLLWVYVCWTLTNSFGQLLFAIWADRRPSPWLIWVGPLLGILGLSFIGFANSPLALAAMFVCGAMGVAAFHPEAAAKAGSLFPQNRSRAMAIFALCGYLGQAVGPFYSGQITDKIGFRGLAVTMLWGLPVLIALWIGLRRVDPLPLDRPKTKKAPNGRAALPGSTLVLLLAVGSLRILPALGTPLALAYILKAAEAPNAVIGAVQSAFMAGIGFGAMACAAFLHRRWERRALWFFPLVAAPLLGLLTFATGWMLVGLVALCGLLLGVTMPVYISYGQQLLPHGQRVASSITMGVSWGIAGGIVALAMWILNQSDSLYLIFSFFAVMSLLSSFLCHLLPTPEEE